MNGRPVFYSTTYESPIGELVLLSDGEALVGLEFPVQRHPVLPKGSDVERDSGLEVFSAARAWLDRYFSNEAPDPHELPLRYIGTDFRMGVWKALLDIPYGTTVSYGELAARIGCRSARAIGGAVGHNPISIIGPCHRVVGSNGSLTGFGGGIKAKVWLLEHEGCDLSAFTIPTKGTAL